MSDLKMWLKNKVDEYGLKIVFGFLGGTCVVLLRYVQDGFYMGETGTVRIAAYLTGVAFIFMAVVVTAATDEEKKMRLLMTGFLAPSFLLATLQQNPNPTPYKTKPKSVNNVPRINEIFKGGFIFRFFESSAYAQSKEIKEPDSKKGVSAQSASVTFPVHALPTYIGEQVVGGVNAFIGRKMPVSYALLVGSSDNKDFAIEFAKVVKFLLGDGTAVNVVNSSKGDKYFVQIGDAGDEDYIQSLAEDMRRVSLNKLTSGEIKTGDSNFEKYQHALTSIASGQVIDLWSFAGDK